MAEQNPNPASQGEKTFTQAEVDEIVRTRLAKEQRKYGDYDDLKKEIADMKKDASVKAARERVAGEKGVPVALLTGEDEESCTKQADALLAFRGEKETYPEPKKNEGKNKYNGELADEWREFATSLFGGN